VPFAKKMVPRLSVAKKRVPVELETGSAVPDSPERLHGVAWHDITPVVRWCRHAERDGVAALVDGFRRGPG
jgi:hypothetical protein